MAFNKWNLVLIQIIVLTPMSEARVAGNGVMTNEYQDKMFKLWIQHPTLFWIGSLMVRIHDIFLCIQMKIDPFLLLVQPIELIK